MLSEIRYAKNVVKFKVLQICKFVRKKVQFELKNSWL